MTPNREISSIAIVIENSYSSDSSDTVQKLTQNLKYRLNGYEKLSMGLDPEMKWYLPCSSFTCLTCPVITFPSNKSSPLAATVTLTVTAEGAQVGFYDVFLSSSFILVALNFVEKKVQK